MSKPKTMEINMPVDKPDIEEKDKNKVKDSIGNISFENNTLKIKKQIESLELINNKF